MRRVMCFLILAVLMGTRSNASAQVVVDYNLRITPGDTSGFDVQMNIRNAPDTFRLAMAAHPEYDDRFWRYVEQPSVTGMKPGATIVRVDSALWRVVSHGQTLVRYRIHLRPTEPGQLRAWQPFMTSTGALVGGMQSFMYIVGKENAPSHVKVDVPEGWTIATALEPTSDAMVFFAPGADVLLDSPILVGKLRSWSFLSDGVPHRVVYWPLPNASPFDTAEFVSGIHRITEGGLALFRSSPYREYTFLLRDGAYGALEHLNSVTLGAPSASLATNPNAFFQDIAHEYFHLWNLMRIRPAERKGLDYRAATETRGLWFSEGMSMFYADVLLRRAKIPLEDTTRVRHLANLIARYLGNSSYAHISPEASSLGAYRTTPGTFGDYSPSVHLQGELIGAMLDLVIRDATDGRRSLDDVMRVMMQRFSGARGFDGKDVERAVSDVCTCNVGRFFDEHVRGTAPIDFDHYLALIGLRTRVRWAPVIDRGGKRQPDFRISAWLPPGEKRPRVFVRDPNSMWARAGVHTGDELLSVNGKAIGSWPELRSVLQTVSVGDTLHVDTSRNGRRAMTTIVVTGYDQPSVTIEDLPVTNEKQRRLGKTWLAALP